MLLWCHSSVLTKCPVSPCSGATSTRGSQLTNTWHHRSSLEALYWIQLLWFLPLRLQKCFMDSNTSPKNFQVNHPFKKTDVYDVNFVGWPATIISLHVSTHGPWGSPCALDCHFLLNESKNCFCSRCEHFFLKSVLTGTCDVMDYTFHSEGKTQEVTRKYHTCRFPEHRHVCPLLYLTCLNLASPISKTVEWL